MAQISMKKLDAAMKSVKDVETVAVTIGAGDDSIDVTVKKRIQFADMIDLINTVVDNVVTAFGYFPEKLEMALTANVLSYYTNLKDDLGTDRVAALLWGGQYAEIVGCIDALQYEVIRTSVDEKIDYLLKKSIAGTERQIAKAADQIQAAADAFKLIEEELSNIGTDKFKAAVENLGSITPAQLIDVMGPKHES